MENYIFKVFIRLIVVMTALPIHEFAHGYIAKKLGDPTAEQQGRLDLNPLSHFDLVGTTALLLTGFGWAKPVPINPFYFKNRKRDIALTALAGPVSNVLLATALLIIYKIIIIATGGFITSRILITLCDAIFLMISTNIGLAVFNLLPVPPLDGSRVIGFFLPDRTMNLMHQYERPISFLLFAVIMFTPILNQPISIAQAFIFKIINFLTGFIEIIGRLFQGG